MRATNWSCSALPIYPQLLPVPSLYHERSFDWWMMLPTRCDNLLRHRQPAEAVSTSRYLQVAASRYTFGGEEADTRANFGRSYSGWSQFCAEHGISMAALAEAVGLALPAGLPSRLQAELVQIARQVTAERRTRRPS